MCFELCLQDSAYIAFFSPTTHPEKIAVCGPSLGVHPCEEPGSGWSWVLADPNDGKYSWTSVYEKGTVVCILQATNAICRMAQLVWSNVFLCGSIAARYAQVHWQVDCASENSFQLRLLPFYCPACLVAVLRFLLLVF